MTAPTTPTGPGTPTAADPSEPSYIDYEAFLSPSFSAPSFANTLVLATNNTSDTPLDLSTPLSRVLFDTQEIDSHIDALTTRSALPLLAHTQSHTDASTHILSRLQTQITALNASHAQLAREVTQKHAEADQVRAVASRLWDALRLARAVARALQLGRQLEAQVAEGLFAGVGVPGAEGYGLERVGVVRGLREGVVAPVERAVRETAERVVREFSMGSAATYAQSEEVRGRTVAALTALYLLTPVPVSGKGGEKWAPVLMLQALEVYLRSALQSSIAGLSRALATLPSLERTLVEVSARCQNVVALEAVLEGTKAPAHPLLQGKQAEQASGNMLQPLLAHLETGSLASYFWRTMAGSMAPRVQEIVAKGGVSARTLRTNRQSVGEAIKECVARGSQLPSAVAAAAKGKGRGGEADAGGKHWEREVAVMVGSIVNNLGR
ncbi:Golgi transport complex subunit 5-domain-containing protein [Parachaetomium inaequale]|uniref:Conserved oligomeric Golgi complex subunit 5 n=1 Tax=Parachaetomium inaequale TaxID=2588326 RepID=A0AAN6PBL2_9PEZI|nr:Golgi transport complex subunit 5-domain-containing protein [Parachaetomium inaequale]